MGKRIHKVIRYWIPLALISTLVIGFAYVAVQQNYRQSANDPQIQMAENAVDDLNNGASPLDLNSGKKIDVATSLSPFYIIFDKSGKVIASNVVLEGKTPLPPQGVLDNAIKSENRLTWQPQAGVRIASVVAKYNNGFVLVGRNLREIENREDQLIKMAAMAWITTIGASFIAAFLFI